MRPIVSVKQGKGSQGLCSFSRSERLILERASPERELSLAIRHMHNDAMSIESSIQGKEMHA